MKLTTSQLRKLIKEEVTAAVTEAAGSGGTYKDRLLRALTEVQETMWRRDVSSLAEQLDAEREEAGADDRYPGAYSYASEYASAKVLVEKIHEHIQHAIDEIEAGE